MPGLVQASWPAPASAAGTTVSTNWAGYAIRGSRFRTVSGSWRVPTGTCTSGRATFSAAWLGLGGYSRSARSLEQTGTEIDCTASGAIHYSAWYELVPAAPRTIHMSVRPGDSVSAKVQVRGTLVTVALRNRTTGQSFTKTTRMSSPDISSAEWIVEAPSACDGSGSCRQLLLADFGTLPFGSARATTGSGHTGTISDSRWSTTKIQLSQAGQRMVAADSAPAATVSDVLAGGRGFSVTYVPGANGGPATTFGRLARAR